MTDESRISAPPIHPLAALATIVLDSFFGVFEVADPLLLIFSGVLVGVVGFFTTTFVQHFLAKDDWGPSIAKGMVMGVIAGVPYPIAGTVIGAPLLIWAGVHQWAKLPAASPQGRSRHQHLFDKPEDE
jgi:hypothetical protein